MKEPVFILSNDGRPVEPPFDELEEAQRVGARLISTTTFDPEEACMPPEWVQEDEDEWVLYGTEMTLRIHSV